MNKRDEVSDAPDWALKGRDGESVTLLQKLEQVMEFGSAMEKLAIENNEKVAALEAMRNLLAIIHHDGGHYTTDHGGIKACIDAEKVVIADRDRVAALERELAEAKAKIATLRTALEDIRDNKLPKVLGMHVSRSPSTELRLHRENAANTLTSTASTGGE